MKKKFKDADYPILEIVCDDAENTGIRLLSIVDDPAIEMMGVAFDAEGPVRDYQFKAQEDKQIIIGPGMIPNKKILRKDEDGNYYYNIFKPETIKKLVQKFNRQGTNRKINVDHSNKMVDAYIMENWIVEDSYYDKSRVYGFNCPVGTWMVMIKVEDSEFWKKQVKELGKFGFSVQGIMGERPLKYSKDMTINDHIDNMTDEDIEYFFEEFKKWRSSPDSANVDKIMYNDQTKSMVIKFNDGEYYTYFNVEFGLFQDIFEGNGICRTSGSNEYGEWFVGKSPSVGAAVYELLVESGVDYIKGGSLK